MLKLRISEEQVLAISFSQTKIPLKGHPSHFGSLASHPCLAILEIPVVVVARDALGTINHTLLTVEYARSHGIKVLGVIINTLSATPDPPTKTNAQVIKRLSGVSLLGVVSYLATPARNDLSSITKLVGEHVDTNLLGRYERY